jgi:NAD(P)-dependent dehydrogenase (short-subunit alcohol dehydrogenase family)
MELRDKVTLITGGASGIGRALALRFAAEGARGIAVVDRDEDGAREVAGEIGAGAIAVGADVASETDIRKAVVACEERFGDVDLLCCNAGILARGGVEVSNAEWQRIWDVNVMAHIVAARAVLPKMLSRGSGYLLHTASAAGLLSQIGSAPYAVTKHAVVALAEWLSITHGDAGIKVSVLCPQAVRTKMTADTERGGVAGVDGMLEPEDVAESVVHGLRDERFLILPHPQVLDYMRRKTADYDRWLGGMRRLKARVESGELP